MAIRRAGTIHLQVAASAKNIGQARVNLRNDIAAFRVRTLKAGSEDWDLYEQLKVFEQQAPRLESGESVGEAAWVQIPQDDCVALGLELYVVESATRLAG